MMPIEIKDLDMGECKTRRLCRRIRENGDLNLIRVVQESSSMNGVIEFDFVVMRKTWLDRMIFNSSLRFYGELDVKTCTMRIRHVEEHLYERIYDASKLLFEDIDGLRVVIEKDFC